MRVVLLWHMHQPDYRVAGQFRRPWVYLHALGGYTDMAARLEAEPCMRAVVNFTPVLLDQLDDYALRLQRWQRGREPIGDALLDALAARPPPGAIRAGVVRHCLPVHRNRRTDRHRRYLDVVSAIEAMDPAQVPDALFDELLVWFHLGWLGDALTAEDHRAAMLLERDGHFAQDDRHALLGLVADAVANVIPRWRALAAQDRVELSTSPYYHPLCPLLIDFESARERAPGVALPPARYPGGTARLRWHLDAGLDRFEALIRRRPAGCWPPEAALSDATLRELARAGFRWTASSRSVLEASGSHDPFRLFRHAESGIHCAFRDDGLSDRIGFEYQHWQPQDAVRDLVRNLETIAAGDGRDLVLIALDGENPWEYYAEGGGRFLQGLYGALSAHPSLRAATMNDCLRELADRATPLPALRAGSWVHGELLTWVGHPEKNHAWEILIEAKRRFDSTGRRDAALEHRLGACEGSDWFWWPGAGNPGRAVAVFDDLFRARLAELYESLGLPPPAVLSRRFASGSAQPVPAGGTMRPGA
jgi:alpha-amylase/alpha-mannosidase (GH57 family)